VRTRINESRIGNSILVRLQLPDETFRRLSEKALAQHQDLDQYLSSQLSRYGAAPSDGFLLTLDEKRELETALRYNFQSGSVLVEKVKSLSALDLGGFSIPLGEKILRRLKSRCIHADFKSWLAKEVAVMLEQYVGLR
jgi:hypothetical protein